jgi:hypothetical protein
LNPRVFSSLRHFFACLYRDHATFRLVEGDRDHGYDRAAIERGWRRAEESNVDEGDVTIEGQLLGVLPIARRFEFQPDTETAVIRGAVPKEFSQSYLEQLKASAEQQPVGKRWRAVLKQRVVTKFDRAMAPSYTLTKLEEIASNSSAKTESDSGERRI